MAKEKDKLKKLRDKIDLIDDKLLILIQSRAKIASKIGELKTTLDKKTSFYKPDRESKILKNRDELKKRVNFFEKKFLNKKISKPLNWSGYRISPNLYEFWQEMPFRLHDRIEFKKNGKKWNGKRLYP